MKATPLPGGVVKAKTGDNTTSLTYLNWYREVYITDAIVNEVAGTDDSGNTDPGTTGE